MFRWDKRVMNIQKAELPAKQWFEITLNTRKYRTTITIITMTKHKYIFDCLFGFQRSRPVLRLHEQGAALCQGHSARVHIDRWCGDYWPRECNRSHWRPAVDGVTVWDGRHWDKRCCNIGRYVLSIVRCLDFVRKHCFNRSCRPQSYIFKGHNYLKFRM